MATLLSNGCDAGLDTAGAGGQNTLESAGRACCSLPETVFVPRIGPLVATLGVIGVADSFSVLFNMLAFVGERARVAVLTLLLLGVVVVDLPIVPPRTFGGKVLGVNNGTGGIEPS